MRAATCVLVLTLLGPRAGAQPPARPFASPSPAPRVLGGTPYPADLWDIAAGMYDCRIVRTRGTLNLLQDPYYVATEGGGTVLIIPMPDLVDEMRQLVGRRVEVVGLVRELSSGPSAGSDPDPRRRAQQGQFNPRCADQDLPPTPGIEGHETWPRMSITVTTVLDDTPVDARRGGSDGVPSGQLAALLAAPAVDPKLTVTLVGRFCGASLCGGLTTPAPTREAWVLQDGEAAVWVVGRAPEGKGFRLDPRYQADTSRWLEVKGRLEPCGTARCLRAQKVALAPRPKEVARE